MWWTMVPWKKLIPVAIGVVAAVAVLTYISYLHIAIDLANGKREVAEELERACQIGLGSASATIASLDEALKTQNEEMIRLAEEGYPVSPIIARTTDTAFLPSSTIATTGPLVV